MALWGQGDKRWIVEERADAKNVNNWHWSEADASPASKKFFNKEFVALALTGTEGSVRISEVTTCTGEASVSNRKGKVIYFFEWKIVLKWVGKTAMSNDNITGTITIENVSEENTSDEVDIETKQNKDGKEHTKLHQMVKTQMVPQCRNIIKEYIVYLQTEFGKKVILPTDKPGQDINSVPIKAKPSGVNSIKKQMEEASIAAKPIKTESVDSTTVDLDLKDTFKCTKMDLYECFINPSKMNAYFHGSAQVDPRESGSFSLLGGAISGTYLEVYPPNTILMQWRFKDWPKDVYSSVKLTFKDTGNSTDLELHQEGIPKSFKDQIKEGWQKYYFNSIKMTFGYGSGLS